MARVADGDSNSPKAMSKATGIDAPHFSKWKRGESPGPRLAAQFARGYRQPVLEAFVAAGFLTEVEARVRPAAAPDFSQLTNDELLELVRSRMSEEVTGDAEHPAPNQVAGGDRTNNPDDDPAEALVALYLKKVDGDVGAARDRLQVDMPEGAEVDEITWTRAMKTLIELEREGVDHPTAGEVRKAARTASQPPANKQQADKQDEQGERPDPDGPDGGA